MIRFVFQKAPFADLNGKGTKWRWLGQLGTVALVHVTDDGSLEYGGAMEV